MATQTIVWTALPNGLRVQGATTSMRLCVLVAPRLDPQASQNRIAPTFPDFGDWPKTVSALTFAAEINGGPTIEAQIESAKPVADLWAKVFRSGDVPVVKFSFRNMALRALRSFPTRALGAYLQTLYRDLGTTAAAALPKLPFAPGAHPALVDLANQLGDVVDGRRAERDKAVGQIFGNVPSRTPSQPRALPGNWTAPIFKSKREADFYQLDRFYARPEFREHYPTPNQPPKPVPAPPGKPALDFHQILAALADHPQLLRRLGIVIDLLVRADGVPAEGMIRVVPKGSFALATTHRRPWTHYRLTADGFFAAPSGNTIDSGLLRLEGVTDALLSEKKEQYDVVTMDPDSAALKVLHFAQTMRRLTQRSNQPVRGIAFSTADEGGVPSLQSNGLALVELSRAWNLGVRLIKADAINGALASAVVPPPNAWGDPHVLHAEDVLRGYRPDILDLHPTAAQGWKSLNRRVGEHVLALPSGKETISGLAPDEGYVKTASAASKDNVASDLYVHETLFKWTGWSLAARPPGRTIQAETDNSDPAHPVQRERIRDIRNETAGDTPLEVNFKAEPHSLPRLRFGHPYRLRVRTVDLAGNSLPPDSKSDVHASAAVTYRRFEPVLPPALLPRAAFGEGASLERLVIRSNYDKSAAAYAADPKVQAAIAGKHYTYAATDERHVVPPKTSVNMAETHGAFDPMIAQGPSGVSKAYRIAAKEAGSYHDTAVVDVATGNPTIDVSGSLTLVTPPGVPTSPPPPAQLPLEKPDENDPVGQHLAPGQYVVYPIDQLHLPYLPDPIARGAALRGLPNLPAPAPIGGSATVIAPTPGMVVAKIPYALNWPDAAPFRIVLSERPGQMPGPNAPEAQACQEAFTQAGKPVWDSARRTLTLFLGKAETARIRYSSYPDKTDVDLMAVWQWLAGASNEAQLRALVEAGCHWMLSPYRELEIVHAVQQPLCDPRIARLEAKKDHVGDTHAFLRDALWRLSSKSTGKVDLHAHWTEWLDEVANPKPVQVTHDQHVLELPVSAAWGDEVDSSEIGANRLRHEFVDTHYRLVEYHLVATTRFREFLPEAITSNEANIARTGPAFHESTQILGLRVPNSARPAAPKVLYVIPTFKWNTVRTANKITSTRVGRGLRVWLERPWFSSGDGELLGVVIDERQPPPADATAAQKKQWLAHRDKMKPYITQWGRDPLFDSGLPKTVPAVGDFTLAVKAQAGLTLDEVPAAPLVAPIKATKKATKAVTITQLPAMRPKVSVAGHAVHFDEGRRLWYSDIEIQAGSSYWPFVRLGLVRYQPESRLECHLSRVVLAEFAQVLPDRRVEVTIGTDKRTLTVRIYGVEPSETGVSRGVKTDPQPSGPLPKPVPPPRGGRNEFEVVVETLNPALGPDFGWSPLAGVTVPTGGIPLPTTPLPVRLSEGAARRRRSGTKAAQAAPPVTADVPAPQLPVAPMWQTTLVLPRPLANENLRLVLRELELYYEDQPDVFLGKRIARRLVYADVIPLSGS